MGAARNSRHASSMEQLSTALLSPSPEATSAPKECVVPKDTTYCSYLGNLVTKLDRMARMPKLIIKSAKAIVSGQKQQHEAKIEVHPVRVSPKAVARLMPVYRVLVSIVWMVDFIFFCPWVFGFSIMNPLWLLRRRLRPKQIRRRALKLSGLPVEQYHLPVEQIDARIQRMVDAVVDNKGILQGCAQKTGGNLRLSLVSVIALEGAIIKQLVADLHVTAARALTSRVDAAPTGAPLVIAALPRSGTTLLLELLSCDKTTWRQLTFLEANMPCFVGQNGAARRRYEKYAEEFCASYQNLWDDMKHIHYEHWAGPTECRDALATGCGAPYSFWYAFGLLEPLDAWLGNDAERHEDYVRYRAQLGAIKVAAGTDQHSGREWLLKDPAHPMSLDALFSVFPDARIVYLHRDPVKVSASFCSLLSTGWTYMYHKEPRPGVFQFRENLVEVLGKICDGGLDYCERNPDSKIHDLTMRALVDDPIAAVEEIYKFAGKTLSATAKSSMLDYLRVNKHEKRSGSHHYSAADFGLDVDELNSRFARYKAKFGV